MIDYFPDAVRTASGIQRMECASPLRCSLKRQHLKRLQLEFRHASCFKHSPSFFPIGRPYAAHNVTTRSSSGQLQRVANFDGQRLRLVTRIPQCQDRRICRPRRPSVYFALLRIAAHPVRIIERLRIRPRPLRRFGQRVPISRRSAESGVMYISWQLRAGCKIRMHFTRKIVVPDRYRSRARFRAKIIPCNISELSGYNLPLPPYFVTSPHRDR